LPLKVCTVDVMEPVNDADLSDGEDGLFCLVTYRRQPVGDLLIRSPAPLVTAGLLKEKIAEKLGWAIFLEHFRQELAGTRAANPPHRIRDAQGNPPTVSLVICTKDRPDDLRRCLQAIRALRYPHVEVLVVDNASKGDETRLAAMDYGVRYVREDKRGLDFARNRGIRESTGRFLAFADDDVIVDPEWVDELLAGFEDESIACATGLTMPAELASDAQILFERYGSGGFRKGYERRIFDRLNLPPAAAGKAGAGANMAFRREVFDALGAFDEALDCGTPAQAGGDLDMFYRILAAGYRIRYQPSALVWHRHRQTMSELQRQLQGYGTAVYAFLTKCALEYRDREAAAVGAGWLRHQLREAMAAAVGRGALPPRLAIREVFGSLAGPIGYLAGKSHASRMRCREGSERRHPSSDGRDNSGIAAQTLRIARRLRRRNWKPL